MLAIEGSDLQINRETMLENFDVEPFGFKHSLHRMELFSFDSLVALADHYDAHPVDYFVSASAPRADSQFFSVAHGSSAPGAAIRALDGSATRILLKRPENHDMRFRALLDRLFGELSRLNGDIRSERVVRLESAIFISSAASITPFHFDPEIAFFTQIEGEKNYHVYSPASLSERELEKFYLQGVVNIGQVPLQGRDPVREHVFALRAGDGFHQPQNSPHWVATGTGRSVSYSFVYETEATRAAGRTRACNHYVRKLGLTPSAVGVHPTADRLKARSMRVLIPLRSKVSRVVNKLRRG